MTDETEKLKEYWVMLLDREQAIRVKASSFLWEKGLLYLIHERENVAIFQASQVQGLIENEYRIDAPAK